MPVSGRAHLDAVLGELHAGQRAEEAGLLDVALETDAAPTWPLLSVVPHSPSRASRAAR